MYVCVYMNNTNNNDNNNNNNNKNNNTNEVRLVHAGEHGACKELRGSLLGRKYSEV